LKKKKGKMNSRNDVTDSGIKNDVWNTNIGEDEIDRVWSIIVDAQLGLVEQFG